MKIFNLSKSTFILALVLATCIYTSCKNKTEQENPTTTEATSSNDNTDIETTHTQSSSDHLQSKSLVYSWVDKLNIRNSPDLKGKVIATANSNDALEFTGDQSDKKEIIVLRGVAYEDNWLKVKTPDAKEGWVFGGAIKQKGEEKGNDPITDKKFYFPKFGKYNLNNWKDMGVKNEEGGDAEIETRTYQRANQTLEITKVEVGDYGYSRTYKLTDGNKLLRKRELMFSGDADPKILTEIVTDYTTNPPTQCTRSQKIAKHHSQMNARPLLAVGPWSEQNIDTPIYE